MHRLLGTYLSILFLAVPVQAEVIISEFLASNQNGLRDEDDETSDWIELYNDSPHPVPLDGWYLTDSTTNRFKWPLPDLVLASGEYLVVFASGKDRRELGDPLHTNFRLDSFGEHLAVVRPSGEREFQYSLFPEQRSDVSYGISQISPTPGSTNVLERHYFPTASPGVFNGVGFPGIVRTEPVIRPETGVYSQSVSVTIEGSVGSTVHYTTDGSEPTQSSPVYDGPFSVFGTTEVRAKGFGSGALPSLTVSHGYIRSDLALLDFDSNLPLVIIDTFGASIPRLAPFGREDIPYTPCYVHVIDRDETGRAAFASPPSFSGRGGIKPRGSISAGREKASFALETWDGYDEDRDVSLLGMPAESDWVLWGPVDVDRAMMRNPFIYDLSNQMGRYGTRTRYVEVFLNTNGSAVNGPIPGGDYFGIYALVEKIKRDDDRVNVSRLVPQDNAEPEISGGYIFKMDRLDPGDVGFSGAGVSFQWVYPKEVEVTSTQRSWLINHLNQFRSALNGPNFTDPLIGYQNYINRSSWIDSHIIHQFAKEPDGFVFSTYFYKDRGGKIELGPVWDFDRTMGSDVDLRAANPVGWLGQMFSHPWWSRLFQDPDFWQEWRDRWYELRQGPLSDANMSAMIDGMTVELGEAYVRNFRRWPFLAPNQWTVEIEQLRDWQVRRVNWIDSQMPATPTLSHSSQAIEPGFELEMSAPAGTIFFTRDGSDPRLPGGAVSPVAFEYGSDPNFEVLLSTSQHSGVRLLVPRDGTLGTSWTDKSFSDDGWQQSAAGIGVGYDNDVGYESLIDFDVGVDMSGQSSSIYLRYEFEVTNPARYRILRLLMKYDDAFVAYLNGQQVTRSPNAPQPALWNSTDFDFHEDTQAVNFESFDLSASVDALVSGANVLAIHGLNHSVDSSDLIFVPELRASAAEASSATLVLNDAADIRARLRRGNEWSAMVSATFIVDDAENLRVTELQYHPMAPPPESSYDDNDFEFIELENTGFDALNLTGVRLSGGVEFEFSQSAVTSLGPGEFVVLVKNLEAFETRYSTNGVLIAGEYVGSLENGGETLRLENLLGGTIQEFEYDDAWYPETDGGGHSLVIDDSGAETALWSTREGWTASFLAFGTPGRDVFTGGGLQIPGDANQNSRVDLGDAVSLLFMLFAGRPSPCEGETAADGGNAVLLDANGDDRVDASDVVQTLTYLYLAGPPHVLGARCFQIGGCAARCGP